MQRGHTLARGPPVQCGDVRKPGDPSGVGLKSSAIQQWQDSRATVSASQGPNGGYVGVAEGRVESRCALVVRAAKLPVSGASFVGDHGLVPPIKEGRGSRFEKFRGRESGWGHKGHARPQRQRRGQAQFHRETQLEDLALLGSKCRCSSSLHPWGEIMLLFAPNLLLEEALQNLSLLSLVLNRGVLGRVLRLGF